MKFMALNKTSRVWALLLVTCYLLFVLWSCDMFSYGTLGGSDVTDDYRPGDPSERAAVFQERMAFLTGTWYSHYAGIGRLDGYRIFKWGKMTGADRAKALALFSRHGLKIDDGNPVTYYEKDYPQEDDYILLYDDTVYGQEDDGSAATDGNWGFAYMGLVRAITLFNGDKDRGAIIVEYFEGCDPNWLWDPKGFAHQGLERGEKPFFGIYYRVLSPNIVQMANAVDLAALYDGRHYYTEKATLQEAVDFNTVENEAELIAWGVVIPQDRER